MPWQSHTNSCLQSSAQLDKHLALWLAWRHHSHSWGCQSYGWMDIEYTSSPYPSNWGWTPMRADKSMRTHYPQLCIFTLRIQRQACQVHIPEPVCSTSLLFPYRRALCQVLRQNTNPLPWSMAQSIGLAPLCLGRTTRAWKTSTCFSSWQCRQVSPFQAWLLLCHLATTESQKAMPAPSQSYSRSTSWWL